MFPDSDFGLLTIPFGLLFILAFVGVLFLLVG